MDPARALEVGMLAAQEVWRVERKFSRYRDDSVLAAIHANRGAAVEVDEETASLIDFASQCHALSDGLFDVTSGVLRHAWKFDGSDRIPEPEEIQRLLPLVGFEKLEWRRPRLLLRLRPRLPLRAVPMPRFPQLPQGRVPRLKTRRTARNAGWS